MPLHFYFSFRVNRLQCYLYIFIASLFFSAFETKGQGGGKSIKDSTIALSSINASMGGNLSGGDFAKRFGPSFGLGVHFSRKTDKNFLWGADYTFLFGNDIREPNMLQHIRSNNGDIFDMTGEPAFVLFFLRGHMGGLHVGKIFPIFGPNPNSGLMVKLAGGYIQHKISVEARRNDVRPVQDAYRDGYDRLTAGFYSQQFIGYQHLSNTRLANFFVGFEFTQGFTQNIRNFNFDTQQQDTGNRIDLISTLRFGWTIPMYRRTPQEYYLY
jgi:hypothetical protein